MGQFSDRKKENVLPGPLIKSHSPTLNEFLWKGDPNASRLQRIGASLFALFYLGAGLTFVYFAIEDRSLIVCILGFACSILGVKALLAAFRRH